MKQNRRRTDRVPANIRDQDITDTISQIIDFSSPNPGFLEKFSGIQKRPLFDLIETDIASRARVKLYVDLGKEGVKGTYQSYSLGRLEKQENVDSCTLVNDIQADVISIFLQSARLRKLLKRPVLIDGELIENVKAKNILRRPVWNRFDYINDDIGSFSRSSLLNKK